MNPLFLDFETRSPADIKKVGAHVYAHHPGTEVSCTGWALAEGDVEVAAGFPSYLRASLLDPEVVLVAHNAAFEREVLAAKLDIHIPWSRIIDTAALAARMAMPRKLEALAIALKLDQQKDMQGHRVMLKLARPKGGWDDEDVEFWDESEKPEDFEALRDYCRQDVAVMRECYRRLLPLSTDEARLYAITGKMNDAGVKVDLESIPPALELLNAAVAEGETEFKAITGGHGVKSYKNVALALGLENVKKPTVRKALRNEATPPRVRRALELFQKLARSSPAKLTALQRRTSVDGRVRGALIYSGAERTQRWSSGGVQLHNLPRGLGEATDEAFRALACGVLDICYDDPVGTIAEALRGFFVGPYIVGDFAQIEARTLNWLAGQKDVLDIFAVNGDVYSHTATKIFGRPITKKSTDDSLPDGVTPRFVGKTVELGCFAADTLVLTDRGWTPITYVEPTDKLWDGTEWVQHGGVVCQGERSVMRWLGIGVTPDHRMLTCEGWVCASQVARGKAHLLGSALSLGSSAWKATNSGRAGASPACESPARVIAGASTSSCPRTCARVALLDAIDARRSRLSAHESTTGDTPTSFLTTSTASGSSTGSQAASAGATTHVRSSTKVTADVESTFMPRGERTASCSCDTCSRCQGGTGRSSTSIESTTTADTNPETFASQPAPRTSAIGAPCSDFSDGSMNSKLKCETYDIAFAGPRNRFSVLTTEGPVIVHNCGYGLGWEKFHRQMDEVFDVQITPDLAMRSVYTYRESHPRVVALWKRLEQAFAYVVQKNAPRVNVQPGSLPPIAMGNVVVGGLRYAYIELPSGRRLYYSEPEMTADGVRYWGRNIYAGGKWDRVSTYGGKIAENITQATSRDVLAYSMLKLDEAGFKLVLQVHDEVVAEVGDNDNLTDKFRMLMMQTPAWASGLPVDVEVFSSHRYRK